jgi:hypothetical protein
VLFRHGVRVSYRRFRVPEWRISRELSATDNAILTGFSPSMHESGPTVAARRCRSAAALSTPRDDAGRTNARGEL